MRININKDISRDLEDINLPCLNFYQSVIRFFSIFRRSMNGRSSVFVNSCLHFMVLNPKCMIKTIYL